jgi:hypothetical protein
MKRFLLTTFFILFSFSLIFTAWAGETKLDGHNLSWGKDITAFPNLVPYKTAGDIQYYQNPAPSADCDLTAGVKSSSVAYGFKNGKLYARFVKLETVADFKKMHDHMVKYFGDPKEKMDGKTHVDRWETDTFKIKLKFNKVNMSMKMGTYYLPLAGKGFDLDKSFDSTP